MKDLIIIVLICLCAGLVVSEGRAQVRLTGGNVLLQISTTVPVPDPVTAVNVATRLRWKREDVVTKITVSTVCPGQRFGLRVLATALSDGIAAPEVTLTNGMPAVDLVVNIPAGGANNKDCTLRYTAIATYSQGNSTEVGNDVHTITYTHVAQ
jgi:hypothetical protein